MNIIILILILLYSSYNLCTNGFQISPNRVVISSKSKFSKFNSNNQLSTVAIDSTDSFLTNESLIGKLKRNFNIVYKFSRPHTIKGTILASFMGVVRALIENPGSLSFQLLPKSLIGLLALIFGNAYIVGINQIYDVEIDKINKPFLPMAASQLSSKKAWFLVISSLIGGGIIVKTQFSNIIFQLYLMGGFLGTIYSVPPFQFKRYPILAGSIIACVRGFLLNFGVYYAVREALGVPFQWNPVVAFISSFMTIFAGIIAVTKDLPDVEGDVKYNIETFASKYGIKKIAQTATFVLLTAYAIAASLPFTALIGAFKTLPMTGGHIFLATFLLYGYNNLNNEGYTTASVKKYYFTTIWNCFYMEYCLYPFI